MPFFQNPSKQIGTYPVRCDKFNSINLDDRELSRMEPLDVSKKELREIIKEAIISTLTERSDLLENAVAEAMLDMKLGLAIEEGDTGEYSDEESIMSLLRD
jgi:hypothetical protein